MPELTRVLEAEHRVEGCLKQAKGEAGMAGYHQVRTREGWHDPQALSPLAAWFLTQ